MGEPKQDKLTWRIFSNNCEQRLVEMWVGAQV